MMFFYHLCSFPKSTPLTFAPLFCTLSLKKNSNLDYSQVTTLNFNIEKKTCSSQFLRSFETVSKHYILLSLNRAAKITLIKDNVKLCF